MLLEVKNISYRYSKSSKWILKDVSFTVDSKERVALVGPSGYGKSTLSKIISGYIKRGAFAPRLTLLWFGVLFYSFISMFMFRSVMPNFLFAEQVTVRSCPCEREQKPSVVNFVNQQPIRLNMAFSITKIIS